MRIAFLWNGITDHYGKRFTDGLYLALKRLEDRHTIGYFEPDDITRIDSFKPDVLLYWAALCENLKPLVASYKYKKAICFAGGPIDKTNVNGFDLYFTESSINEYELEQLRKPWMRAFGINERVFKPKDVQKEYDAIFWGAFAQWKRHDLFAPSVEKMGISIGQHQAHEPECYNVCKRWGVKTLEESSKKVVVDLINKSYTALNTANFFGGGQRMTLEAMACNVPPIVMIDSPKNSEYVRESGYGIICDPNVEAIREAILKAKEINNHTGREYIMSKYTSKHYADALEKGLQQL